MVHQCGQCGHFSRDMALRETCAGNCTYFDGAEVSGYSESGYSEFYTNGRECPGFVEPEKEVV